MLPGYSNKETFHYNVFGGPGLSAFVSITYVGPPELLSKHRYINSFNEYMTDRLFILFQGKQAEMIQ